MPYCTKCGKEIEDNAKFCPSCGASQSYGGYEEQPYDPSQNNAYNAPQYQQQRSPSANYDSGSVGWAILGFFIPIVGLILFIVWLNEKPKSAKMAGIGALISVILSVLWSVFFVVYLLANPDAVSSIIGF